MDRELAGSNGFLKIVDDRRAVLDPIGPSAIGTTHVVVIEVNGVDFQAAHNMI